MLLSGDLHILFQYFKLNYSSESLLGMDTKRMLQPPNVSMAQTPLVMSA